MEGSGMRLAFGKLKNLGWIALVLIVAISLYPLSLSVATLRSDLARTESKIVKSKRRIRYLETEFATRASLKQLDLWNELDYGYSAPTADQYLGSERALANLGKGRDRLNDIVQVAMVDVGNAAGTIGSPFGDGIPIPKTAEDDTAKDNAEQGEDDAEDVAIAAAPSLDQSLPEASGQIADEPASRQADDSENIAPQTQDSEPETDIAGGVQQ
jgi:hypothetical protein